eukprot:15852564-Heterocapsa_arctica.AAC.1
MKPGMDYSDGDYSYDSENTSSSPAAGTRANSGSHFKKFPPRGPISVVAKRCGKTEPWEKYIGTTMNINSDARKPIKGCQEWLEAGCTSTRPSNDGNNVLEGTKAILEMAGFSLL